MLDHERRVAERVGTHQQAEGRLVGHLAPAREHHVALEDRPVGRADDGIEVIPRPQRVVAQAVGRDGRATHRGPVGVLVPDQHTGPDGSCLGHATLRRSAARRHVARRDAMVRQDEMRSRRSAGQDDRARPFAHREPSGPVPAHRALRLRDARRGRRPPGLLGAVRHPGRQAGGLPARRTGSRPEPRTCGGCSTPPDTRCCCSTSAAAAARHPTRALEANTTWHLVADIERLRVMAGCRPLARVRRLVGIDPGARLRRDTPRAGHGARAAGHLHRAPARRSRWYYQDGASWLYPDLWEGFLAPIPPEERDGHGRVRIVGGSSTPTPPCGSRRHAPGASGRARPSRCCPTRRSATRSRQDDFALAFARIENHYFVHDAFLEPGQLIRDAHRLRDIPGVIVQGRYDLATPMRSAWDLHRAWPEAELPRRAGCRPRLR